MTDARAMVGTVLQGETRSFRVERLLGAGERGTVVFRGVDVETGEPAAVRCPGVPDDLGGLSYDAALDEFEERARLLARLCEASSDVEQLLAFGVAKPAHIVGRLPFCVFEWLQGRSLEEHIVARAGNVPSLTEAMAILEPAARALAAAHDLGIAHRDVRPKNLWLAKVDGRLRLKVTQFALAARVGPLDDVFAPEYGAPEQFKSSYGAVGPATDVYGLALCLVELVSGRHALEGTDPAELYLATSDLARRPTLRARGVQASGAIEAVVARALAVDPRRRWPDARAMWEALADAVPELTPALPPAELHGEEDEDERPSFPSAPPRKWALPAAGALLLAAVGIAASMRTPPAAAPTPTKAAEPRPEPRDAAEPDAAGPPDAAEPPDAEPPDADATPP